MLEKNIEDMIEDYLSNSSKITPAIEFLCSLQNGGLQQLVYHSIIYALEKNTLERLVCFLEFISSVAHFIANFGTVSEV